MSRSRIRSLVASVVLSFSVAACSPPPSPFDKLMTEAQTRIKGGDLEGAKSQLISAITLAQQSGDNDLGQVKAINDLADIEKKQDHIEKLRSLYEKSAKICDVHLKETDQSPDESWLKEAVRTYSGLGAVYSNFGTFTTAETYYRKAIEFEEHIDMPSENRRVRREFDALIKKTAQEKYDVDTSTGGPIAERAKLKNEIGKMVEATYRLPATTDQKIRLNRLINNAQKAREKLGVDDPLYILARNHLYNFYVSNRLFRKARELIESDEATYRKDEQDYLNGVKIDEYTVHRAELLQECLSHISACLSEEVRVLDAIKVVDRRIKLLEHLKSLRPERLGIAYAERSDLASNSRDYTSAVKYNQLSIELLSRNATSQKGLQDRYSALSQAYALLDKPSESAAFTKKYLSTADVNSLPLHEVRRLLDVAQCMLKNHEDKNAVDFSEVAFEAASKHDVKTEADPIFNVINEASRNCFTAHDVKAAESILDRGGKLLRGSGDHLKPVALLEILGDERTKNKEYDKAIAAYKQAVELMKSSGIKNSYTAGINNRLACAYKLSGRLTESIPYYNQSIQWCLADTKTNPEPYQSSLLQLMEVLRILKRLKEGRDACQKALSTTGTTPNSLRYSMSAYCCSTSFSVNLNLPRQAQEDMQAAKKFYFQNKAKLKEADPNCEQLCWLGVVARHCKNYRESQQFLQEFLEINKSKGDWPINARCLIELGKCFKSQHDELRAEEFTKRGEEMAHRLHLNVTDLR